ncbi:MAG: HdeD family acid-resistance protein [Acidimicrobiales bacterium]
MTSYSDPYDSYSQSAVPNTRQAVFDAVDAWPVVLFVGLVTAMIGLLVLAWPDETLEIVSILFGIQLLLFGVFRLISAFSNRTSAPVLLGLVGVLGMVVGVVVLRNPFESIAVLATLLGVVWIVGGSIDLLGLLVGHRSGDSWMLGLAAALTILAGIVVVAWPGPTLTVIAWVAGLYLLAVGLVISAGAFKLKSLAP